MTKPPEKKYLLLMQPEEQLPEQLNSYLFLIMEVIALAKKLGRIFVLPHLNCQPRKTMICEISKAEEPEMIYGKIDYPMESFFNIDKLNEYIETISFNDFVKISNKNLSVLCCFNEVHPAAIETYGETFGCKKVIKINDIDELNSMEDSSIGITGYKRGRYLIKTSPNWHNDPDFDYWGIRSHLVYNDGLIKTAEKFIQKHLNCRYAAFHWRKGDRCLPEIGMYQEETIKDEKEMKKRLEYHMVGPIRKVMRRRNLNKVFLATNSGTKWHVDYLKSRLPLVTYPSSGIWQNFQFESMIEQLICEKSDYYFSSPFNYKNCSSFSRRIIDSRKLAGKGNDMSYLKKMGPIKRKIFYRLLFYGLRLLNNLFGRFKKIFPSKKANAPNEEENRPFIDGVLFDDKIVTIDSRSISVGGSWTPYKKNLAKAWDQEMVKLFYEKSKRYDSPVVLDVGANTGSFSLLASLYPSMKVYSFEPQPLIYDILLKNICLNKLNEKVFPFKLALSNENGTGKLHVPAEKNQSGLATLGEPKRFDKSNIYEVELMKLDDFASKQNISNASLIKIDVEGAELFVLKGGENFIRRFMPTMLIECDERNTMQFGYDLKEILYLLMSWGYDISWVWPDELLCEKKDRRTVL